MIIMINYKELLHGIVSMLNSPVGVEIKPPHMSSGFKIQLTENNDECSVTLDVGFRILKEHAFGKEGINDDMYKCLYVNFIQMIFKDHLLKCENDMLGSKTFVDTPKGKMWFDSDASQNEQKWMDDKMNGNN